MINDGFEIQLDKLAKKVIIRVSGKFVPEKEKEFFDNYINITKQIKPVEYTLFIDVTAMQVVSKEHVDKLSATFGLYKQTGFAKVNMKLSASAVIKMQLTRLAKEAGLLFEMV